MTPVFVVTLADALWAFVLLLLLLLCGVIGFLQAWKKARCKHDGGVYETRTCEAVCKKCSTNLGFIGKWREQNKDALK